MRSHAGICGKSHDPSQDTLLGPPLPPHLASAAHSGPSSGWTLCCPHYPSLSSPPVGRGGGCCWRGSGLKLPTSGLPWERSSPSLPLPLPQSSLGVLVPRSPSPASLKPLQRVWSLSWQPSRPQGCISAAIGLNLFSHFPVECVSWVPGSNEQEEWAGLGVPPASGLSLACRPWGPLLCRRRAPGSAPPCHKLCFSA